MCVITVDMTGACIVTKRDYLYHLAANCEVYIHTWSPGDGVTRYRFTNKRDSGYFETDGIHTSLGLADAITYIEGYFQGYNAGKVRCTHTQRSEMTGRVTVQ
jgi:hypothetical protein